MNLLDRVLFNFTNVVGYYVSISCLLAFDNFIRNFLGRNTYIANDGRIGGPGLPWNFSKNNSQHITVAIEYYWTIYR